MNYGSIMYAAQSNTSQKPSSNNARCYKTTFSPPKKEVKQKSLSANVQKFLAKQEEEKRRKEIEARRKRDELLELRSHDKMSVKRVSTMLKRTKSANKSVMEDAIDEVNTVVTMAGPAQCDEDDYGYVSQEASSFYNKLMDKYSNMPPEEDKFSKSKKVVIKDLNAAKERVKAALHRVEEEEMMPRKRKRKSKDDNEEDDFVSDEIIYASKEESKEEEPPKPKKIKRPAPPPMDFSQLLKIAEQKQYEPIVIEKKPEVTEEDKPMTKKQRLEYLREKEARIQRERRQLEEKMRRKHPQSQTKRQSSPPSESSSRSQQKPSKPTGEVSSVPRIPKLSQTNGSARIPKINQTDESSNVKSNKSSSEEQNLRIPKLSDRDKPSQKPKYVPPSVAEEILKKSGSVWSKPCNLSPSSSPSSKSRYLDNHKDDKRKSISDSKSSAQQNLDRRKDVPNNKPPIKKPVTQSQTTSDLERKKEMMRQKMKEDMAIRKEMMKNSANRALNPDKKPNESSNRYESQNQKYKIDSNTSVKNGVNKNTIANKNPKLNGDSHSKSAPPKSKVLADLFGDNFPNDDEPNDRNKSSKSQQNSSKSSTLISSKERDDKFNNKSSSLSLSKNVSKQSPQNVNKSIVNKNISNNNNNNTKQLSSSKKPATSSSNGLKQRPQINDRSRPSDVRPRQFPPADLKPKQFPPPDMRPRQFPPPDVRRNPMSKHSSQRRRAYEYDDEEEEYDSELDDFIVDDDEVEEDVDVSKCIKEIFRYDKNRYRDADYDDDEVMESNYADVMKEEVKSTRIAIQEDLEEFLKEKAEKKRLQERKLQKLAEMKKKKRF